MERLAPIHISKMATAEVAGSLPRADESRFNPVYWDGNVLGQDDPEAPLQRVRSPHARVFACQSLMRACRGFVPEHSLKHYGGREKFHADEFDPGTVLVFNEERVRPANNMFKPMSMTRFRDKELREPPTNLDIGRAIRELDGVNRCQAGELNGIIYSEAIWVAVVSQDMEGHKILSGIRSDRLHFGCLLRLPKPVWRDQIRKPSVLQLGEVRHYGKKPNHYSEYLSRINALEIRDRPEPARRPFLIPRQPYPQS